MRDHMALFLECDRLADLPWPTQAVVRPVSHGEHYLATRIMMPPTMRFDIVHIPTAIADAGDNERFVLQFYRPSEDHEVSSRTQNFQFFWSRCGQQISTSRHLATSSDPCLATYG